MEACKHSAAEGSITNFAQCGGDVAVALRGAAGAGLGGVLGNDGAADVVQRFDAQAAYVVGQAGGMGLDGQGPGPAGDPQGLGGVWEVEAGDGGDLELCRGLGPVFPYIPTVPTVIGGAASARRRHAAVGNHPLVSPPLLDGGGVGVLHHTIDA
jgi:hypothetical protein